MPANQLIPGIKLNFDQNLVSDIPLSGATALMASVRRQTIPVSSMSFKNTLFITLQKRQKSASSHQIVFFTQEENSG